MQRHHRMKNLGVTPKVGLPTIHILKSDPRPDIERIFSGGSILKTQTPDLTLREFFQEGSILKTQTPDLTLREFFQEGRF